MMALLLEQSLQNADVVRYHRITQAKTAIGSPVVEVVLESFRNFDHRAMPVPAIVIKKYQFTYSGGIGGEFKAGYDYIKSLPEWAGSSDC